ncbi:MAG: response regulator transcription factor [Gaiellaceae bacterium]
MRRILVAEDDTALRGLYRLWLEHAGYVVLDAPDGGTAIGILERGPLPDAAVLDVDMPRVDGIAVCRYLHARAPGLPVVIATGTDGTTNGALAAGAAVVLAKPFAGEELLAALAEAAPRVLRRAS